MMIHYQIDCECGDVAPDEAAVAYITPDGPEVGDMVVDRAHLDHDYELGDPV